MILADPDAVWTAKRMHAVSNDDEHSVEQSIEVLRSIGAVTVELIPNRIWMDATGRKRISEHGYRLTEDGPRRIQDALDASRYRPGPFVTLFVSGWGPARMLWQARRGAGRPLKARKQPLLARDDELSYLDPEVHSRFGRLRRWLEYRYVRGRTKKQLR